ncbi:hypothetical protein RM530_01505 [Algiphilus sp. W345]|uniref:Uncharacterized protein n=1 Tax=Banduia mediterranea TaxID=3075609 RepID=A0ABU2WDT7_9GAMM|nr:hypothetical protein [Algiphilus sp. W345]MDT0496043.1 hypothetical protein [Algiphilus sp. W345]
MIVAKAMKLTKPAMPTPASAGAPSAPTIQVSTRLSRFCDISPPMIGKAIPRTEAVRSRVGNRSMSQPIAKRTRGP